MTETPERYAGTCAECGDAYDWRYCSPGCAELGAERRARAEAAAAETLRRAPAPRPRPDTTLEDSFRRLADLERSVEAAQMDLLKSLVAAVRGLEATR